MKISDQMLTYYLFILKANSYWFNEICNKANDEMHLAEYVYLNYLDYLD